MPVHVINLDRDTDRMARFSRRNAHLPDVVRIPAIDGASVDRESLHMMGTITGDLAYTNGNLGCALSHIKLWRRTLKDGAIITVVEDDVTCARNFHSASERVLEKLPNDWDIVFWGWNFDEYLWTEIPEGVAPAILKSDQNRLRENIEIFRNSEINPSPFRLRHLFGTMGYSISPSGAKALLDICLPLANITIAFGDGSLATSNHGIDCTMNTAYPLMKAYVSIPPLVVSENEANTSRTRHGP